MTPETLPEMRVLVMLSQAAYEAPDNVRLASVMLSWYSCPDAVPDP